MSFKYPIARHLLEEEVNYELILRNKIREIEYPLNEKQEILETLFRNDNVGKGDYFPVYSYEDDYGLITSEVNSIREILATGTDLNQISRLRHYVRRAQRLLIIEDLPHFEGTVRELQLELKVFEMQRELTEMRDSFTEALLRYNTEGASALPEIDDKSMAGKQFERIALEQQFEELAEFLAEQVKCDTYVEQQKLIDPSYDSNLSRHEPQNVDQNNLSLESNSNDIDRLVQLFSLGSPNAVTKLVEPTIHVAKDWFNSFEEAEQSGTLISEQQIQQTQELSAEWVVLDNLQEQVDVIDPSLETQYSQELPAEQVIFDTRDKLDILIDLQNDNDPSTQYLDQNKSSSIDHTHWLVQLLASVSSIGPQGDKKDSVQLLSEENQKLMILLEEEKHSVQSVLEQHAQYSKASPVGNDILEEQIEKRDQQDDRHPSIQVPQNSNTKNPFVKQNRDHVIPVDSWIFSMDSIETPLEKKPDSVSHINSPLLHNRSLSPNLPIQDLKTSSCSNLPYTKDEDLNPLVCSISNPTEVHDNPLTCTENGGVQEIACIEQTVQDVKRSGKCNPTSTGNTLSNPINSFYRKVKRVLVNLFELYVPPFSRNGQQYEKGLIKDSGLSDRGKQLRTKLFSIYTMSKNFVQTYVQLADRIRNDLRYLVIRALEGYLTPQARLRSSNA